MAKSYPKRTRNLQVPTFEKNYELLKAEARELGFSDVASLLRFVIQRGLVRETGKDWRI